MYNSRRRGSDIKVGGSKTGYEGKFRRGGGGGQTRGRGGAGLADTQRRGGPSFQRGVQMKETSLQERLMGVCGPDTAAVISDCLHHMCSVQRSTRPLKSVQRSNTR